MDRISQRRSETKLSEGAKVQILRLRAFLGYTQFLPDFCKPLQTLPWLHAPLGCLVFKISLPNTVLSPIPVPYSLAPFVHASAFWFQNGRRYRHWCWWSRISWRWRGRRLEETEIVSDQKKGKRIQGCILEVIYCFISAPDRAEDMWVWNQQTNI